MANLYTPIKSTVSKIMDVIFWTVSIVILSPVIILAIIGMIFYFYFVDEIPLIEILRNLFIKSTDQYYNLLPGPMDQYKRGI